MSLLIVAIIAFVLLVIGLVNTSEMKTALQDEYNIRLNQILDLSVHNLHQTLPGDWQLKKMESFIRVMRR